MHKLVFKGKTYPNIFEYLKAKKDFGRTEFEKNFTKGKYKVHQVTN